MVKTVEITQKHIDNGEPECPYGCAISLALYECLSSLEDDEISVHTNQYEMHVYSEDGENHLCNIVPVDPDDWNRINSFIEAFDERDSEDNYTKDVEPFSFDYKIE